VCDAGTLECRAPCSADAECPDITSTCINAHCLKTDCPPCGINSKCERGACTDPCASANYGYGCVYPFECKATAGECQIPCSTDANCATDMACLDGQCLAVFCPPCDANTTCVRGKCVDPCASANGGTGCAPPYKCDVPSRTCQISCSTGANCPDNSLACIDGQCVKADCPPCTIETVCEHGNCVDPCASANGGTGCAPPYKCDVPSRTCKASMPCSWDANCPDVTYACTEGQCQKATCASCPPGTVCEHGKCVDPCVTNNNGTACESPYTCNTSTRTCQIRCALDAECPDTTYECTGGQCLNAACPSCPIGTICAYGKCVTAHLPV
jgi:hypothetical protein